MRFVVKERGLSMWPDVRDGNPYSESDRRTSGSRFDGTNRTITPTAKTYTGDGLLKITIPKNAKVQIYFENA